MREGIRCWLIRGAWAGLLVCIAVLVFLRVGRPVYYTDGARELPAYDLAASGMVVWQTPEVAVELPGPVQGRVATLPDGRLLYGRSGPDGTTDLVVFDPAQPQVLPEPAYGLNTEHNELAPAVDPAGQVFFASDRTGGVGGYDLYRASWTPRGFSRPEPLPLCNTAQDETDPAPAADGDTLVFARVDPERRRTHGALWRCQLSNGLEPHLLFQAAARRLAPIDRDPAFTADGGALWFVRQVPGRAVQLYRASMFGDEVDEPVRVGGRWGVNRLRAPDPGDNGLSLGLLQPRQGDDGADLWFVSTAREVYPWWPGQRWLEWGLISLGATLALLLLLLLLGRRWRTLDLLAQCLLLSLLLHVLACLWLMGVEITGALLQGREEGGSLEVTVVSSVAADPTTSRDGQRLADVAAAVRFTPSERTFEVATPGAVAARAAAREIEAPAGALAAPPSVSELSMQAEVDDAAAAAALKAGVDAALATDQADLPAVEREPGAAAAAARSALAASASAAVVVQMPAAAVTPARTGPMQLAASDAAPLAAPVARAQEAPMLPAVADAATTTPARRAALADERLHAVSAQQRPVEAGSVAAATATTQARRPARPTAAAAAADATVPAAQLARGGSRTDLAADVMATPTAVPAPGAAAGMPGVAVALRDASAASLAMPAAVASDAAPAPVQAEPQAVAGPSSVAPEAAADAKRAVAAAATSETAMTQPNLLARAAPRRDLAPVADAAAALDSKPVARAGRPAMMALRDHSGPVAAVDAAPAAAVTPAQLEQSDQPLPGPKGRVAHRDVSRGARPGEVEPLPVTEAAPGSSLARAFAPVRGPDARRADRLAMQRDSVARSPTMPLRDAKTAAAASTAARAGELAVAAPSLVAAALLLTPGIRPLERPQRALSFGLLEESALVVEAPGSLLERGGAVLQVAASLTSAAAPTAYSNRFGPRKAEALERFGGNETTERAVSNGLAYLARIQQPDGSWGDRTDYDSKYGLVYVGKTALCLLAFLGAGHTPQSDTEHSGAVARAVEHLLALQEEDTGAFGPSSCYGHGITAYALAECYGMTKDERLLQPLKDALSWILVNQGPRRDRRNRGGWGYFSPGLRAEDTYARVSVTSWMVMALESARMSGIEVPDEALPLAREYLVAAYDAPNGWFRYNHQPSRLRSGWPTLPASTPAGAFCLQLLGVPAENDMVQQALQYTVVRRPRAYRRYGNEDFVLRGQGNVYFWYYGSLCCFLAGGEAWERWNERLSTVLPQAQSEDGSFKPIDVYAEEHGDTNRDRSYTTAMCVLSLEVYYRYFTPLLVGR